MRWAVYPRVIQVSDLESSKMRACRSLTGSGRFSREELNEERRCGTMQERVSLIISGDKPSVPEQVEVQAERAVVIWSAVIREKLKVELFGRDGCSLQAATMSSDESGGEEPQTAA